MKTCALALFCLLICSCDDARGVNHPGDAPSSHLVGVLWSIGTYITWFGGAAIALGLLAFGASFVPWVAAFAGELRGIFLEIAIAGLALTLVGCAFLWVGDHPWVLGAFTGTMVLALGVRYRRALLALLRIRTKDTGVIHA